MSITRVIPDGSAHGATYHSDSDSPLHVTEPGKVTHYRASGAPQAAGERVDAAVTMACPWCDAPIANYAAGSVSWQYQCGSTRGALHNQSGYCRRRQVALIQAAIAADNAKHDRRASP